MLPDNIAQFLAKRHLLSMACVDESGLPYAANCFYAFDKERALIYIASSKSTVHMAHALRLGVVAGTVALDTRVVGRIQGVQFKARVRLASNNEPYFKRFAYARVMSPTIWELELFWIKFTSNTLGFGKKIVWQHNEAIK